MFLFIVLASLFYNIESLNNPRVKVEQGILEGTFLTSSNGRIFAAFQGIPYAQPPVGNLRFKEPTLPKAWTGIWNASLPGNICLQYQKLMPYTEDEDPIIGEEDCLYLNVYTPQISSSNMSMQYDVIFYIHGGAFMYGWSHQYGPKYLLDKDIIVVTPNYRLGPLGFLSTEDEVVPGNNGLKDQTAALLWVNKNIAAFGGNPNSITLIGNSAGGVSVHYHYVSPLSRGLFQRGFSQSGSILCPWSHMENGKAKAIKLGSTLGCPISDSHELIDCLRNRPARQIVQQVKHFLDWIYNPFAPFGPTVEVAGSHPFTAKQPIDAILDGDVQDLPWMTSVTMDEGLYPAADWIANDAIMNILNQKFNELIPHILDFNYTVNDDQKTEVANRIRQHYLQDSKISKHTIKEIIKMSSDRLFILEVSRAAKLQAAINSAPVYFYLFDYRGKYSLSNIMSQTNTNFGVSHADDTGYTVDCVITHPHDSEEDKQMSNLLVDIWYSFAHDRQPVPSNRNFTWKPIISNSKELSYLYISDHSKLEMRSSNTLGNQDFWDSLPINEPQIGKNTPINTKHTEL